MKFIAQNIKKIGIQGISWAGQNSSGSNFHQFLHACEKNIYIYYRNEPAAGSSTSSRGRFALYPITARGVFRSWTTSRASLCVYL